MTASRVDTYEDFAAWRNGPNPSDHRTDGKVTVGDAMRRFTATPITVICEWFGRWRDENAAKSDPS
jgi:hypothetical protein